MIASGRHRQTRQHRRLFNLSLIMGLSMSLVLLVVVLISPKTPTENAAANPQRARSSATPPAVVTVPREVLRPKPSMSPVVPRRGSGAFRVAEGSSARIGNGRLTTYQVEVEVGIPLAAAAFAKAVDETLADPRGWTRGGLYAFRRAPGAQLRVVLASPKTTDQLCAPLDTGGEVSCRNGNIVAINAKRWFKGAPSYGRDIARYRQYVVNHEVGHALELEHAACPGPRQTAPVMLQQTLGLAGCVANPWPSASGGR